MISDQSTSLFMLRSNALAQQITLLSCSLFLVSSILFLPIVNRHPVDTVLIPFANIEKYPLNVGSLGFGIGGLPRCRQHSLLGMGKTSRGAKGRPRVAGVSRIALVREAEHDP